MGEIRHLPAPDSMGLLENDPGPSETLPWGGWIWVFSLRKTFRL